MLRLTIAGPDTVVTSTLCATCPHSPAGCCVAPPRYDWSDIARVVHLGGRDWLLEQIERRRVSTGEHGLYLRRVKARLIEDRGAPRLAKCVFHGISGCTIAETQRPATCNFYVCESAYEAGMKVTNDGPATVSRAREAHDAIVSGFIAWDAELRKRIASRWPEGIPFDAEFLEWLDTAFAEVRASQKMDASAAARRTDSNVAPPRPALILSTLPIDDLQEMVRIGE